MLLKSKSIWNHFCIYMNKKFPLILYSKYTSLYIKSIRLSAYARFFLPYRGISDFYPANFYRCSCAFNGNYKFPIENIAFHVV
jgi:hypothetical protein